MNFHSYRTLNRVKTTIFTTLGLTVKHVMMSPHIFKLKRSTRPIWLCNLGNVPLQFTWSVSRGKNKHIDRFLSSTLWSFLIRIKALSLPVSINIVIILIDILNKENVNVHNYRGKRENLRMQALQMPGSQLSITLNAVQYGHYAST